MGWGKIDRDRDVLPEGVTRVEYLESTGTQWIDTGIYGTLDTVAKFRACATAADALYPLFGSRSGYRTDAFAVYNGSDVGYKFTVSFDNVYSYAYSVSSVSSSDGDWHDFVVGKVMTFDSWRVDFGNIGAAQFTTPNTMLLFAWNQNGTIYCGKYKVSYLQIYSDGALARDMIPVRIGSEGAMYDRVSGQIFRNQGTGSFIYGPDTLVSKPVIRLHRQGWDNPYVTYGLVSMYDGEWNVGYELHDGATTVWKDLHGSNNLSVNLEYSSWNEKSISLSGLQYYYGNEFAVTGSPMSSVYTIEAVADIPSSNLSHGCFLATGYKSRGIGGFGGGWLMSAVDRQFNNGQCLFHGNNTVGKIHSYVFVYLSADNNGDVTFYDNGQLFTGTTIPYGASTSDEYNLLGIRSNVEAKVFALRIYNRALTADEIAANYAVDKARFNLP